MSMKKPGVMQVEDFALYNMLNEHKCFPTIPSPKLTYSGEQIFKEAISAIEGWAHDYNNTHDSVLEHIIMKKIETFAADQQKLNKFFADFITVIVMAPDDPDWRILKKVFGTTCTKRSIKFLWTARFNLLTFIDRKDFLYLPFTKIWLTLEQCSNISTKFFTKDASKTMEHFSPKLNNLAQKIRNKDMVCVSNWYELLFEQFCIDNTYSVKQYQLKSQNQNSSFMTKCFAEINFADTKKGRGVEEIIRQKRETETKYPTHAKNSANSTWDKEMQMTYGLAGNGNTDKLQKKQVSNNLFEEEAEYLDEDQQKSLAVHTYARSAMQKNMGNARGQLAPSTFSSHFEKCPKIFLKNFREHESFARRALRDDNNLRKKYDFQPPEGTIELAFNSCKMKKNKGIINKIFM